MGRHIIGVLKFGCPRCMDTLRWEIVPTHSSEIVVRLIMKCDGCGIQIALPIAKNAPAVGIMSMDNKDDSESNQISEDPTLN